MLSIRQTLMLVSLFVVLVLGWNWFLRWLNPVEPKAIKPPQEAVAMLVGGLPSGTKPLNELPRAGAPQAYVEPKPEPAKVEPVVVAPKEPSELIPLGHASQPFALQVLLNTEGGSVQQVILTHFAEADREGLPVKSLDGTPTPLPLIPGTRRIQTESLRAQRDYPFPSLRPGKVEDPKTLEDPSYVLNVYDRPENDRPSDALGKARWKIVSRTTDPEADRHEVTLETQLDAPHFVKVRKIYSLTRNEYHVGLRVEFERLPGKTGGPVRYQLSGPIGIPIEGEWYTTTFRQALIGMVDKSGRSSRTVDDARDIRASSGTDRYSRSERYAVRYAAVGVQYFSSAIVVSDVQDAGIPQNFIEAVRATPVGQAVKDKAFLDDITVRAISDPLSLDKPTAHQFLLYQGPVKVRLLKQLEGDRAVPDEIVDRYLDKLNLGTLTDAPMSNFFGRFANAIYWSDLVIALTNMIHGLLFYLNKIVPNYAIGILCITVFVRGALHPLSRKQMISAQIMQAKQAKMAPELKKLQEKYGSDMQRMNQERMKLYAQHGMNPGAMLGGCLPLFFQMPVFMGLYYAIQESIFLRLAPFAWIPNLAAPDMLAYWSERIPFISTPSDLGTSLYLGPFFNILPLVAVGFMIVQQSKMMPASEDPQVQAQQKMMKFMTILFAVFFYKVAAGLCIYFIAGTLWSLTERQLIPKLSTEEALAGGRRKKKLMEMAADDTPPPPKGAYGRWKANMKVKWEKMLEDAAKQQTVRRDTPPPSPPATDNGKFKNKKKRK